MVLFFVHTCRPKKSLLDKRIECKWSEKSLLEANNDVACSEYFMRLEKVHSPHYNTERCNEKKRNMNISLYSRLMGQNLSIRFFCMDLLGKSWILTYLFKLMGKLQCNLNGI